MVQILIGKQSDSLSPHPTPYWQNVLSQGVPIPPTGVVMVSPQFITGTPGSCRTRRPDKLGKPQTSRIGKPLQQQCLDLTQIPCSPSSDPILEKSLLARRTGCPNRKHTLCILRIGAACGTTPEVIFIHMHRT
jgi:hypothetical protein